jgi:hypothetical protein
MFKMISFERIAVNDIAFKNMNVLGEVNFFQTLPWLNFLSKTQNAEPVLASVKSDGHVLGYFTGLIINKYGIRILGSPFRGWNTYFMGFNLVSGAPRSEIFKAFPKFVFKNLRCLYFEIIDPNLLIDDVKASYYPYKVEVLPWYAIDLSLSEDVIFKNMKRTCRQNINKSMKCGVVIEEANDLEFANDYYTQYTEVMSKHSLAPTYDAEYVKLFITQLLPTGNMLLLRANNPKGNCIATAIFLALNKTAVFWGAASWKDYQIMRPNEALAWYGIRKLKSLGIQFLHFGGHSERYKKNLGCQTVPIARLMKARYSLLDSFFYFLCSSKNVRYKNWMLRKFL